MNTAITTARRRSLNLAALALCAASMLSACGGAPQGRPFDASGLNGLVLGSSSRTQAVATLGAPLNERVASFRKDLKGQQLALPLVVRILHYEYAEPSSSGAIPWVTPRRELYVQLLDDQVQGYLLRSTFKADSTDFDPLGASGLSKGLSTEADVLRRLGPPAGRSLWPLAMSAGGQIWTYGVDIDNKSTHTLLRKRLYVYLDAKGQVEDFAIDQSENSTVSAPASGGGGSNYTPVYVPSPVSSSGSFKSR
jgi:hypothetical protein